MGHGAYVPDVVENVAGVADQNSGEFAVVIPGAGDGPFIDFLGFFVEEEGHRRNVGLRAVEAYIALALLLGIVKRMGVKKRPDELAADVFEAEFEMSVLVDGVMAAVKRGGADVEALLVGDFFGSDQPRRVTGARGGNGGVERMRESVAESDAGWGGFDELTGARAVKHARLGSHVGEVFYTAGKELAPRTPESTGRKRTRRDSQCPKKTKCGTNQTVCPTGAYSSHGKDRPRSVRATSWRRPLSKRRRRISW